MNRAPHRPLDLAIIGMACRFPGARDLFAYWRNVLGAVESITDVPKDRWDTDVFFDAGSTANDRVYCRRGGYLDAPIPFDPLKNGVAPSAVEGAEPEQFLVLDSARAALLDAGMTAEHIHGLRADVIIGRGNYFNRGNLTRLQHGRIIAQTVAILRDLHPDWSDADFEAVRADLKSSLPPFGPTTISGQLTNATAGLVANRLNLTGASYVVDAASASALVALQLGARALAEGTADLALVGAIFLATDVDFPQVFSQLGALSRLECARPFARDSDGTVPGEGVGVVVLKRLAEAERDRDRIYAVVKGIGVASDGKGRGLASPSARGHARALRRAYRQAGIDPATVGFVEGHGLGVPAADRAELRALRAIFPKPAVGQRVLGSLVPLIGHAMPAAGIAALIKTALALHHRILPVTPRADDPHPLLADESSPFALNRATRPWIHGEFRCPRRAGVNAFGFAGINAHAVLEEHAGSADSLTPGCMLDWETEAVLLGAPDRAGWLAVASALLGWLERGSNAETPIKDLAYTLSAGQPRFAFRVGFVVRSADELRNRLRVAIERLSNPGCGGIRDASGTYFWDDQSAAGGRVAFLYAGEGSQYPGMLADLCLHFPEVRALFDTADRVAIEQGHSRRPSDVLFADDGSAGDAGLWSMGTAINVVLSAHWALHRLLLRLGIRPDAVMGHSSGEFLSLAAAGVLDVDRRFEDRLGELGTLFERLERAGDVPTAALVAVAADAARVVSICRAAGLELRLAIDNCPHQVVVSGAPADADALIARLRAEGIVCERLPFARAYHTDAFAGSLGPVDGFFGGLPAHRPSIPIYSCATARPMGDDVARIRRLAVEQWAKPVAFRSTIEAMYADGVRIFVEVGTRGSLTGFVEDTLRGRPHFAVAASLPRRAGITQLNHLLASLFAQGVAVQPEFLHARRRPERLDLDRDRPVPRAVPALQVGFPEMRLSRELVARLTAPRPELRNGHGPARASDPRAPLPVSVPGEPPHLHAQAMLDHFRTMDAFLAAQAEVMSAYLTESAAPAEANGFDQLFHRIGGNGAVKDPSVLQSSEPSDGLDRFLLNDRGTRHHDAGAKVGHNGSGNHHDNGFAAVTLETAASAVSVERVLLEQVARRTGYPLEMLGLDLDIEGDLGIDSIKRVEILGEIQEQGLVPPDADLEQVARCKTLRQVLELLHQPARPAAKLPPWVGTIVSHDPARSLVAIRRLDASTDPVAAHHTLGGRRVSAIDRDRKGLPVVPFTVMAEMLAQAASVLVPDGVVISLREVQAFKWIRYEDEPVILELRAERDEAAPDQVRVEIENKGTESAPRAETEGPVVSGTVVFGTARPPAPWADELSLDEARPCRFTADELYDDQWLFHGPALRALVAVGSSSPHGIEGTLRVLPRAALFGDPNEASLLKTDPIVLDAFTHLLGCWGLDQFADGEGDVIFPLRLGALSLYGDDPPEGTDVSCRIVIRGVSRHRVNAEASVVRPDGRVWMRIDDWDDWRFYWPSRYRDQFRRPDGVLVGEPLALSGVDAGTASAVWLEPPADMARPVWRDVLEWVQLSLSERGTARRRHRNETSHTLHVWGRVAAKEAVRRLWLEHGLRPVYPADLEVVHNHEGQPQVRCLSEPDRSGLAVVSIAHTDGVAVALAGLEPNARVGIDVEPIIERKADFADLAFTERERRWLAENARSSAERAEWQARFWCAKEAVAKAAGLGLVAGPASAVVTETDPESGVLVVELGSDLIAAFADRGARFIRAVTARRGDRVWAWTLGEPVTR
jgi:acyl transferase domain-containing protein/phosphopantetheinyl transferase (holo-ACP synthase)